MNGYEFISVSALLFAIVMLLYQIIPWSWLNPFNRKEGFIWGVDPGRSSGVATLPEIDKMIDARVEEMIDAKASEVRKKYPHLFEPHPLTVIDPNERRGHAELTDARGQVHKLDTEEVKMPDGTIRYVFKPLCTAPRHDVKLFRPDLHDAEFHQGH